MLKLLLFILITFVFCLSIYAVPQIKLNASQEKYYESDEEAVIKPSQNGIYPVCLKVTIESNDRTIYVKVYRSKSANGPFSLIIDSMQPNEEYFYLYDSTPMEAGIKYYYIAVLGKEDLSNAKSDQKSNIACGWGALTHEAFYVFFNTTLTKSYSKMTLMNKPNALNKLGSEETNGNKSGTFKYNAKVKGMGGVATMSYKNYSDDNLVFFTGDMITYADMFSSGNMDGYITMSGMYNGTVGFKNVQIKNSKANEGTYSIKPFGTDEKDIPYTWNFVTNENQ